MNIFQCRTGNTGYIYIIWQKLQLWVSGCWWFLYLSWNSLVLFDEVMRLYLNCHTYNDKSEVHYLIYEGMPASSNLVKLHRQISNYRLSFNYRFPDCFKDRKARFWRNSLAQICSNVKLNNFNLHTYNDKSEVHYLIYEGMPASSKSRQTSPVDFELLPQFWLLIPQLLQGSKGKVLTEFSGSDLFKCQVK